MRAAAVLSRALGKPTDVAREGKRADPFRTLIGTALSLRTKDEITGAAAKRLFAVAPTPRRMLALSQARIQSLIFPVGFYRVKARHLHEICRALIDRHGGKVPSGQAELLRLKGVGRKTANLVLGRAFGRPAICVDTHVHRISNRLGIVVTRTPAETERELMAVLPRRLWIGWNGILVEFGKRRCRPLNPACGICELKRQCPQRGIPRR